MNLYLDGRLVARKADAASLGAALIALRARAQAQVELVGNPRSLLLEKSVAGLEVALLERGDGHGAWAGWDHAVEAAAEFLAGLPGREGGLLAKLKTPPEVYEDRCPLCRAMQEGRL